MSYGVYNTGQTWIELGVPRENLPFLETPHSFLKHHPAWSIAHTQFFDCHPELECAYNRKALAFYMLNLYQTDLEARPVTHNLPKELLAEFRRHACDYKSSNIGLSLLKFFGTLLINAVTFGLYGLINASFQKRKIARLENAVADQKEHADDVIKRLTEVGQTIFEDLEQSLHKRKRIEQLEHETANLKQEIESYKGDNIDRKKAIEEAKKALEETEEKLDEINAEMYGIPIRSGKRKGWIDPVYTIKSNDPLVINGIKKGTELFDRLDTMDKLINAAFLHTLKTMESLGHKVRFNKSSQICEERENVDGKEILKHLDKIQDIYKFMVFHLILRANLKRTNGEDACLILNQKGLTVASSKPYWVDDHKVLFKNHDDWTPLDPLSDGVDPISIKFLLVELQKVGHLDTLCTLLCASWIPNSFDELKKAKRARDRSGKTGEILKKAELLINDIANVFYDRYHTTLSWKSYFNDPNAVAFNKQTYVDSVEDDQEKLMKAITVWEPDNLPIKPYHPVLVKDLVNTKRLISPIWNNIRDVLANPLTDCPNVEGTTLEKVTKNYWSFHLGINDQGCLFSALATLLLQGSPKKKDIDPLRIKKFLASWIEGGAGECFQSTIAAETDQWDWERYALFLHGYQQEGRGPRETKKLGSLEIDLLCYALGIHVQVFLDRKGKGQHIIKDGLMTPLCSFGAVNSKEKFTLFCAQNHSFYALFPKVRKAEPSDSEDMQKALNFAHQYWKVNDGIEYWEWEYHQQNTNRQFIFPGS